MAARARLLASAPKPANSTLKRELISERSNSTLKRELISERSNSTLKRENSSPKGVNQPRYIYNEYITIRTANALVNGDNGGSVRIV